MHEQVKKPGPGCSAPKMCALVCRIDALLDQVDLGSQVLAVDPIHILEDVTVPRRDSRLTAWVNVIFGCNERCTYCVVPNTRGREQSRDPAAIKVAFRPPSNPTCRLDYRLSYANWRNFEAIKAGSSQFYLKRPCRFQEGERALLQMEDCLWLRLCNGVVFHNPNLSPYNIVLDARTCAERLQGQQRT